MPPQLSDDESSISSKGKGKAVEEDDELIAKEETRATSDNESGSQGGNDDDDEDDEIDEDEFIVEAIMNHVIDDQTEEFRFEVKWEGYDKKSDRTWEPEENLSETAAVILNTYLEARGGKEHLLKVFREKRAESKSKKRGRSSTGVTNGNKKSKASDGHPSSSTPPKSVKPFEPPKGNWEDDVVGIDAAEGNGEVVVYLTWRGGGKTQHPLAQIYKRCPQKMLQFYESHLVFKKSDE